MLTTRTFTWLLWSNVAPFNGLVVYPVISSAISLSVYVAVTTIPFVLNVSP